MRGGDLELISTSGLSENLLEIFGTGKFRVCRLEQFEAVNLAASRI